MKTPELKFNWIPLFFGQLQLLIYFHFGQAVQYTANIFLC